MDSVNTSLIAKTTDTTGNWITALLFFASCVSRRLSLLYVLNSLLAVFQRDIVYIMDGNAEFCDEDNKILNVDRMRMIADVLHKTGTLNPNYHLSFPYEKNTSIVSVILQVSAAFIHFPVLTLRLESIHRRRTLPHLRTT